MSKVTWLTRSRASILSSPFTPGLSPLCHIASLALLLATFQKPTGTDSDSWAISAGKKGFSLYLISLDMDTKPCRLLVRAYKVSYFINTQ